jgi:hypothetical protein
MGTSRGYRAPTGGPWPSLKRLVTEFGAEGGGGELDPPPDPQPADPQPELPDDLGIVTPQPGPRSPQTVLARYVQAHRGGGSGAGAGGSGGGGGTGGGRASGRGIGRAAPRVGRALGGFAARVGEVGLAQTLREFDLGELVGRPAEEVTVGIVERLCGPGTTMDVVIAQVALNRLHEELLRGARTFEEVAERLQAAMAAPRVGGLVMQFYGHYIYERFSRDFYERLVQRVGGEKARASVESIRRTIFASLRAKVGGREAGSVDWRGPEGLRMADTILEETLAIFGVGT